MSHSKENKVVIDGLTRYGGLNQPNLKFVKLNVDCWEKIFDWLSLRDILAMSQTCQRMLQIGGHYFRENFHGTVCSLDGWSVSDFSISDISMKCADFLRFIDTLLILEYKYLEQLRMALRMDLLCSLTTLRLQYVNLDEDQLRELKKIQTNIEAIELSKCRIQDNSVGKFLASCPKLKLLRFFHITIYSTKVKNRLFQRTYPMLEHFECQLDNGAPFEWTPFLERNPSIKGIHIRADDLCRIPLDNPKSLVRLDYIEIEVHSYYTHQPVELANHLKALHSNGWYKTLRLPGASHEAFVNEMVSFGALEALYPSTIPSNLSHFTALKELHFTLDYVRADLSIAMNLINLERLRVNGDFEDLLPFLRHSKKLKMIIFHDIYHLRNVVDLFAINKMRQLAGMKHKIQIGVHEKKYLATIWKANKLNYDLVEVVRHDTIRKHFLIHN